MPRPAFRTAGRRTPVNRRAFLQRLLSRGAAVGSVAAVGVSGVSGLGALSKLRGADPVQGALSPIRLDATLQASAFAASSGDDGRYHALVHEEGGAATKSLLVTPVSDAEIVTRLREMGVRDGGGVPVLAWTLRNLPLVPWPDARVRGTPVRIRVEWEGWERPRELGELLRDPGGEGISFRFGGNEDHDATWPSGCIACLYSCPGGVISNDRYTIRDKVRGSTRFAPAEGLPPDGTRVGVVLEPEGVG